jgi:phage tail sheath protein FI
MPNFVSPGVYVIEKDISDYPVSLNSSIVGIVGFADRGPIAGISNEKATLITSPSQLVETFGSPAEAIKGQALEGALEILETTNSMRFIRVADSSRLSASATATLGGCPAVGVSGTAAAPFGDMSALGSSDNTTSDVRFVVSVYDNNRATLISSKTYNVPSGTLSTSASNGATTILALKKVMGGALDADDVGAFGDGAGLNASSFLVALAAGGTATLEVSAGVLAGAAGADGYVPFAGLHAIDVLGASGPLRASLTASGVSVDPSSASYLIQSLWPGAGYNAGTKADGSTSGVSFEVAVNGGSTSQISVNDLGVALESFKIGAGSGAAFAETVIGTTYDGKTSTLIKAAFAEGQFDTSITAAALANFTNQASLLGFTSALTGGQGTATGAAVNPRFLKLVQGTYNLDDGDSGIPSTEAATATAVIGSVQADGGKTGIEALDDPLINVSIALAPGPGVGDNQSIQNALITKAESTTDFLAIVSPPYAVGTTGDAIDWSNGFATTRTAAINSSYASIYWPWLKVFQVFDGIDRWLAPEIYAARQMTFTDSVSDPWFAPAGFVRGRLTKPTDVEVVLNQGDRDSLYSGGNVINPVVNFPQNGIAIFGQRTAQREPTALDRINVRRMMIYIKKVILASTQRLIFEPNDQFTWDRVENLISPLMDDISRRRGITQFSVICDETTNTPIRIDRNEMWCKVLIKPTKTAEMVVFELNLTSQSANF